MQPFTPGTDISRYGGIIEGNYSVMFSNFSPYNHGTNYKEQNPLEPVQSKEGLL
jgi:hypothetical protein